MTTNRKSIMKICAGVTAVLLVTAVFGLKTFASNPVEDYAESAIEETGKPYRTYTPSEDRILSGRYYLNGDTNNYYIDVKIGDTCTVQLVSDNVYAVFDKWEHTDNELPKSLAAFYGSPREFKVVVLPTGKSVIGLKRDIETIGGDPDSPVLGPVITTENTLTGWGLEGDFILVD